MPIKISGPITPPTHTHTHTHKAYGERTDQDLEENKFITVPLTKKALRLLTEKGAYL